MALTASGAAYIYDAGTGYANTGVRGADLEVEPGQVALVLGPTGSGKSTLLKMLAGLLRPTSGAVTADGASLTGPSRVARGAVGLVFQDPESQLFAETVAADVAFGPSNLGSSRDDAATRASEALVAVGLDPGEFGSRSPFGLSGGEARRVAIAGVLAMRPRYLLLDEPTAGLDAGGRAAVCAAVASLKRDTGIVVVTHDAEQFLELANHVLVLHRGETSFAGPVTKLLEQPEVLSRAGLLVPEVIRAQVLAEERAAVPGSRTADVAVAAARLARAAGWSA